MAMVMDDQHQQQQQQLLQRQTGGYKHYCKVCNKGFGCGQALGGHMRAHGDDGGSVPDNDDEVSGELDGDRPSPTAGSKRMYSLRNNSNRVKTCRVCENCGKEFVSWKSFLEHGKCSSEDDEIGLAVAAPGSNVSSPRSDNVGGGFVDEDVVRGWSKGKRSRRSKAVFAPGSSSVAAAPAFNCPSSEEEDLANCLVMLSSARVDPEVLSSSAEPEESCASASKDEDIRRPQSLSQQQHHHTIPAINYSPIIASSGSKWKQPFQPSATPTPAPRGLFECKACKRVFTSHQALGGHRASHKKVKGCFLAKLDDPDEPPHVESGDNNNHLQSNYENNVVDNVNNEGLAMAIVPCSSAPPLAVMPFKKKSKVHQCSICHRVFASGQALGGHKRCHWITSNAKTDTSVANTQQHLGKLNVVPPAHEHHLHAHQLQLRPMFDAFAPTSSSLDLNLPEPIDEHASSLRKDIAGSPLRLDIPASFIYIQKWAEQSINSNNNTNKSNAAGGSNSNNNNNKKSNASANLSNHPTVDIDEAENKVKLAKLSELKDVNRGGDSSPWLQVGIGSSTNDHNSSDHHQP